MVGKASPFLTQNLPPSGVHRSRESRPTPLGTDVQEPTWAAKGLSVICLTPLILRLLSPSAERLAHWHSDAAARNTLRGNGPP